MVKNIERMFAESAEAVELRKWPSLVNYGSRGAHRPSNDLPVFRLSNFPVAFYLIYNINYTKFENHPTIYAVLSTKLLVSVLVSVLAGVSSSAFLCVFL